VSLNEKIRKKEICGRLIDNEPPPMKGCDQNDCETCSLDVAKYVLTDDVLGLLEGYVAVPRKQLQKSIEDIKVDLLGMFCYQGPPTRHWIETKGQFWKGWNEACDKIIERLLRDDGKRPTK